ncbi:MAG: prolyl-tRNA synthetase associated domain-containing protein [Granulosicoccus sp.]
MMTHSERPDPECLVLNKGEPAATVSQVLGILDSLHIEHQTICHEPLYTVEQASKVKYGLPGAHTKNLFLRNKKGRMILLVVEPEHTVNLRALRDRLNLTGGQWAFASTERLEKYLGVVPGSVSPLALINDHENAVGLYIQDSLLLHDWIYMHPCRNTHSTRLRTKDLLRLMDFWNHPVTQLSFDS